MKFDTITYKRKQYPVRVLTYGKYEKWVAQVELGDLLYPDGNIPANKEAEAVDESIYYYANEDEWELNDVDLKKSIES